MGTQLVRQVEAMAMHGTLDRLTMAARLVLWVMATDAHDTGRGDTPAACYFRGWEHLASVLGHRGLTSAGQSAVARAMRELQDAGLVKAEEGSGLPRLRKQVYRLTL